MNEFKRHKKSDKIKWVFTGIAFVLVFVMIIGMCLQLFGTGKQKPSEWFKKPETEQTTPEIPDENGGAVINESASNGVRLMSKKIARAAYAENGISPQADSAYTLTATITPAEATSQGLTWSVAWVNANGWAAGKTVTDYVTVNKQASNALTATVTCLQAFGEQIKITCKSEADASKKADCLVDYAQKITSITCKFFSSQSDSMAALVSDETLSVSSRATFKSNLSYMIGCGINKSVGTISDTYRTTATFRPSAKFLQLCSSAQNKTLSYTDSGILGDFIYYPTFLSGIYGDNVYGTVAFKNACSQTFSNAAEHAFTLTVSVNGEYSNYEETYKFRIQPDTVFVNVQNVSLDKANLVF